MAKEQGKAWCNPGIDITLESMWRCLGETCVGGCWGELLPTTAQHLWAAELQAQKYLLNELCSCHLQLFFLFLFPSLSRDHLQKGKQLLSNKTQMYFTKEQGVAFRKEIFLWRLIQPTCSTTNCKILDYWLVARTVMVPGAAGTFRSKEIQNRNAES